MLSPEFLHHDLDLAKSRYTALRRDRSPLPRSVCGAYCARRARSQVQGEPGPWHHELSARGSRDHALFVNCDGHGPYGHDVADFVVRAVHRR